ncbi:MAG: mechanosensitive ion channel family protein [Phycisphaeraceae bacterium]|nr:mechanosensitive ion channel family protein [Phycisphaeraceae bacterium]
MTGLLPLLMVQDETGAQADQAGAGQQDLIIDAVWLSQVARQVTLDWGLKIIGALLVLLVTWILAAWARRIVYQAINRPRFDQTFVRFLSNLVRWVVLVLGLVACLGVFGINTTSLAAMVGAAGLAIGLAVQGSLSNLAAGIMLLVLRPFKVGDVIQVGGHLGTVDEIELFNVKIDTPDNRRIIFPNSQVFGAIIENITHNPRRRADVMVGVEYAADTARTREVLVRAVTAIPGVLSDPAPAVVLLELGASSVNWRVSGWCVTADFWPVRQAITESVKKHLEEAGLTIPFPQMDVWMRSQAVSRGPQTLTNA